MAKTRRQYSGAAVATTVGSALGTSGVTTFTIASDTGWPSTPSVPFYVVVSPQTSSEEKMSVTRSGTTLTVVSRGIDGTVASSHASGASIYPVFTATDADEANELTSKYATQGSIVYEGSSTFNELTISSTPGHVLKVNSSHTAPEWGQVPQAGIADGAVSEAKLATDAVTNAKIAGNAVGLSELATAVQNFLVPVGTIAMYGGATAPTGWLLCDGGSFSPSSYPTLNTVLGGTNTPDLKGRFAIGDNSTLTLLATGGSATIAEANLPAHKHAVSLTSGSSTTGVSTQSAGAHSHTTDWGNDPYNHFTALSGGGGLPTIGGSTDTASAHTHAITDPGHTHSVSGDTATTGSGTAYYPPYVVVNYIIKHD